MRIVQRAGVLWQPVDQPATMLTDVSMSLPPGSGWRRRPGEKQDGCSQGAIINTLSVLPVNHFTSNERD